MNPLPTPSRRLFVALLCLPLCASLSSAAELEQKQGQAVARLYGPEVHEQRLVLPLSGELLLTLSVEGAVPRGEKVEPLGRSPDWEVRPEPPVTRPLESGRPFWQQQFHLLPRKPGDLEVPLQPLPLPGQEITWTPFQAHVATQISKADPAAARPVLPPEEVPPLPHSALNWLFGVGGVLLAAAAVLGFWASRRKTVLAAPTPPHEWALRELGRIESLPPAAAGAGDRQHMLLSDVVRRYFGLRFEIPASTRTTPEFLEAMPSSPHLTPPQQELLRDFLQRCDLAKFAGITPTGEECRAAAEMARNLVQQTAPQA